MATENEKAPPDTAAAAATPEQVANNDKSTEGPASPPLPAKHTAATPGPRAARLQELFASSLRHTLARLGWDNFAACYPTVAARAPATLRAVQKQMVERLGELALKEFNVIMETRAVVPKLNELESLVSDAARRREAAPAGSEPPIPPHLLPAQTILSAHLAPHLAAEHARLNGALQAVQAENARLFAETQAQRAELESLLVGVELALKDVQGAASQLDAEAGELAKEAGLGDVAMEEMEAR